MEKYRMSIRNKRVYEFYEANKHLGFEQMSCLMVEILERTLKGTDTSVTNGLGEKVLESINGLSSQVQGMDTLFENKFESFKREYTLELNSVLRNVQDEKLKQVLKDYNDSLHDKTKHLFNEVLANNIRSSFSAFDTIINSSESRINSTINKVFLSVREFSNMPCPCFNINMTSATSTYPTTIMM